MTDAREVAHGSAPTTASQPGHEAARAALAAWLERLRDNVYATNPDFRHTVAFHLGDEAAAIEPELVGHGQAIADTEPLAAENDLRANLPVLEPYDAIGRRVDEVRHHGSYRLVGNVLYGSGVVRRLARPGGLQEGHAFFFLNSHLGDAGHNCPIICSYETARVLGDLDELPERDHYVARLIEPSYDASYSASQFLTEVQGGSDVGANATVAWQDDAGQWRIRGEKWFASNADADLNVITARISDDPGTKGLSAFLVPAHLPDGSRNAYTMRRLKEKLGTRALATAEIDYHDAWAIPLSDDETNGFSLLMSRVIHHSRLALTNSLLGMTSRAYQIARAYADVRTAFDTPIIDYALVRQPLAEMRAEVLTYQAGLWRLLALQDRIDTGEEDRSEAVLLVRVMANVLKHLTSEMAVRQCHRAMQVLGGNGAIESFSSLPRLLRDCLVEENWEGTHNTIRAQVLRDLDRFDLLGAYRTVTGERDAFVDEEQRLRSASPRLRPLLVQDFVRRLGDRYSHAALVEEAGDQRQRDGREVKGLAAALFDRMRSSSEPEAYDQAFLDLIEAITID